MAIEDMGEPTEYGDRICPRCNQQVPRMHRCLEGPANTSSAGLTLTPGTLKKLMADLGPMPQDVRRHELRPSLWVPDDGKLYRLDMAASRRALAIDAEVFDVTHQELAAAPNVVVMAHPAFLAWLRAEGMTDLDILATAEALHQQEEREL